MLDRVWSLARLPASTDASTMADFKGHARVNVND